jgi:hypothetical protein
VANKKIRIEKSSLPLVNFENKHLVRYKIVFDKTKSSDWSNIYALSAPAIVTVNGVVRYSSGVIDVIWDNTNRLSSYDIFVKYDLSESYKHHGTTTANNYSVIPKTGASQIYVLIQAASSSKKVSTPNKLLVFEGNVSW